MGLKASWAGDRQLLGPPPPPGAILDLLHSCGDRQRWTWGHRVPSWIQQGAEGACVRLGPPPSNPPFTGSPVKPHMHIHGRDARKHTECTGVRGGAQGRARPPQSQPRHDLPAAAARHQPAAPPEERVRSEGRDVRPLTCSEPLPESPAPPAEPLASSRWEEKEERRRRCGGEKRSRHIVATQNIRRDVRRDPAELRQAGGGEHFRCGSSQ